MNEIVFPLIRYDESILVRATSTRNYHHRNEEKKNGFAIKTNDLNDNRSQHRHNTHELIKIMNTNINLD